MTVAVSRLTLPVTMVGRFARNPEPTCRIAPPANSAT
jgi:hypothetical protein